VVDVVGWTAVTSVVDDVEDDVLAPTVVVVAVSVAQAPLIINTASPAANDAQDLISAPRVCVRALNVYRADGVSISSGVHRLSAEPGVYFR
ncbi:MAG: hypothetical protein K0T01_2676, partial [Acidimicrobiia bacterium]|nr:hypothetical protein [Acidimicrobiia bacterium]